MYSAILARSFSKHEQKRLGCGAFVACFLVALSFCTVLKPYLGPLPILNLRLSIMGAGHKMLAVKETTTSSHKQENVTAKLETMVDNTTLDGILIMKPVESANLTRNATNSNGHVAEGVTINSGSGCNSTGCREEHVAETVAKEVMVKPLCNITGPRTDVCDMKGDIRIQPSSSSVFVVTSELDVSEENQDPWKIRPYTRKEDKAAMSFVREWLVRSVSAGRGSVPQCTRNHSVPAVLFSVGGYTGNHFHEFTDIIVPLYLTSRPFDREVQFLITNHRPWWVTKYRKILENLSRYEIIDIDREKSDVHCFPSMIVGLKRHGELSIDPARSAYTMKDFRGFLRSSYSLKRSSAIRLGDRGNKAKPRLLIVSRKRTRTFTNVDRIARMARRLGFEAVVAEPNMNLQRVADVVNSCDVVMGVHGAGLTNILFLPDHAVVVQILPFGNFEWISRTYFGEPSKGMDIGYLEYKISLNESTLMQQFPLDDIVFKDPSAFQRRGWEAFKSVYLDKQDIKLNIKRFRPTLQKALELLRKHGDRSASG